MNTVKSILSRLPINILFLHLGFWIIAFCLRLFTVWYYFDKIEAPIVIKIIIGHLFQIIIAYSHLWVLIPRFLKKKKITQYILFLILSLALIIIIKKGTYLLFGIKDMGIFHEVIQFLTLSVVYGSILTAASFFQDEVHNQELSARLKEAEKDKISSELKYLKAQIQPHFLFNTLNNIYSMSLNKSEQTSEYILMLSELMSYVIYDSSNKFVKLEKELSFIENYIGLEKIRLATSNTVTHNIDINTTGCSIAPLLLIPIVENAFKHGTKRKDLQFNMDIKIITDKDGELQFYFLCENAVDEQNKVEEKSQGIGLLNLKQRLERLYLNNYDLSIHNINEKFSVELKINMNQINKIIAK